MSQDIEFIQVITANGIELRPRKKLKQTSLDDFINTLIENVGEIEIDLGRGLHIIEIEKTQYLLLFEIYKKIEDISRKTSNSRYWTIRNEGNFIYSHKEISASELKRCLFQIDSKMITSNIILITIPDSIIYLSRAKTPQTPMIKKTLIELEKAKKHQYKQLEEFLVKELRILDQEMYLKCTDDNGKLIWSKYEEQWSTSLWRTIHRHRFELARIKREIPLTWEFDQTVVHHNKKYNPNHLASNTKVILKKDHKD